MGFLLQPKNKRLDGAQKKEMEKKKKKMFLYLTEMVANFLRSL